MIPLPFSIWNAFKSGSDVITKVIESISFKIPSNFKTMSAVMDGRYLLIAVYTCWKLLQIETSRDSIIQDHGGSVVRYRVAASKRHNFKETVTDIARILLQWGSYAEESSDNSASTRAVAHPRRHTRSTAQVVKAAFSPTRGDTPRKKKKREHVYSEPVSILSQQQLEDCTGIGPYRVHDHNKRRQCEVCDTKCNHYCSSCHTWLCINASPKLQDKKVYHLDLKGKDVTFDQTWWNIWHNDAQEKLLAEEE